mgnify:CR=1 FL=1
MGSQNTDGTRIDQSRVGTKNIGRAYTFSANRIESETFIENKAVYLGTEPDAPSVQRSVVSQGRSVAISDKDGVLIERVTRALASGSAIDQGPPWLGSGGVGPSGATGPIGPSGVTGPSGAAGTIGAASGDISGIYPGLTVVGLRTFPISSIAPAQGETLTFDGTEYIPSGVQSYAEMVTRQGGILRAADLQNTEIFAGVDANLTIGDGVSDYIIFENDGIRLNSINGVRFQGRGINMFMLAVDTVTLPHLGVFDIEQYTSPPSGLFVVVKGVGTRTVRLPADAEMGQVYWVKDGDGTASSGNIAISPLGGKLLDGQASGVLDTNYESRTVIYNGTQWSNI